MCQVQEQKHLSLHRIVTSHKTHGIGFVVHIFLQKTSDSLWIGDLVLSFQEKPAAVPKSVLSFPNTLHPQGDIGRDVEKCCELFHGHPRFWWNPKFSGLFATFIYILPGEIPCLHKASEACPSSAGCLRGTPWSRSGGRSSAGSSRGPWRKILRVVNWGWKSSWNVQNLWRNPTNLGDIPNMGRYFFRAQPSFWGVFLVGLWELSNCVRIQFLQVRFRTLLERGPAQSPGIIRRLGLHEGKWEIFASPGRTDCGMAPFCLGYLLVNQHGCWNEPFIVDLPIKRGDFPKLC